MPQTVSEKIYEAFFANLAQHEDVKPETIEGLKALYAANRMADSRHLDRLVQEMENRYAQAKDADG
jgi:hypothetical protein